MSWNNTAKLNQNTHKERHQPQFRNHLGFLEKKQDYIIRAKDYNKKYNALKLLKKRVLNKNPDEFYFHMINSKKENSITSVNEGDEKYSDEQIKLIQTQDIKYVNYKCILDTRKIDNLHNNLHIIDAVNKTKNKHIFFIDKNELRNFNVITKLNTHSTLLNRRINRPKLDNLEIMKLSDFNDYTLKIIEQQKHMAYKTLSKRVDREQKLNIVQQTLEVRNALKNTKTRKPKKISSGSKNCAPIYKWIFERKK
ncbi:PREDICTED: probable U3 small nucleolar RNA-associated protein 11 [Ceratosolen solmsi marchali]|uniref:U3 small nucleolar RNA-associated protein 11 n=1 Tax=Ceratosolen solmsi marchali TaxID=326594 RepID=A0AAJ7DUR0_9HYME|nr:PREDICTED: probable U3 small nucleolar RNA-associated protein 11 [Ceratosolen solmsi marchali]